MKRIIIIGGGITGLSTAYFLQTLAKGNPNGEPLHLTLMEASPTLGGKIATKQRDGFTIEGGPDAFITQKPWGVDLCRRIAMGDKFVQTNPAEKAVYVLSGGRLLPYPEDFNLIVPRRWLPFIKSPLISLKGKVRMGMEMFIPRRPWSQERTEDETIGAFVRRRLGEEALAIFAQPVLAGIYAGDAERLSLRATFPQFAEMEDMHRSLLLAARRTNTNDTNHRHALTTFVTLRGGMITLVDTLARKLEGTTIRTGHAVDAVIPRPSGYDVVTNGRIQHADAVILTVSAKAAARWMGSWDNGLGDRALAMLLQEIEYTSTATVSLGFKRAEVSHPLNGFGVVVPRREQEQFLAMTWSSTKFPERAPDDSVLIRFFLGGPAQARTPTTNAATSVCVTTPTVEGVGPLAHCDDQTLVKIAREACGRILGIHGMPVISEVFRFIDANPQYYVGHRDRVAAIERRAGLYPGIYFAGSSYRGLGIPDCIRQGEETARRVIRDFTAVRLQESTLDTIVE